MKKLIFISILLIVSSVLFAQNVADENKAAIYPVTVSVEKIYQAIEGYLVQYRMSYNRVGTVAIPIEWFSNAASKAVEVKLSSGTNWPTLTIFYKEGGEFSHLRLYVHKNRSHSTWGNIPPGTDLSRFFEQDKFTVEY